MFSKTCEYALRAVIYLVRHSQNKQKSSIKDIAKGIGSPEYFIAKILQSLGKKGYVSSVKGPSGGFYLNEAQQKQSVRDIIIEIDGDKIFSSCVLGLSECSETHPCPMHNDFKPLRENIKILLNEYTLKHFLENDNLENTFLTG